MIVCGEDDVLVEDVVVNEVFDGFGVMFEMLFVVFGCNLFDDVGVLFDVMVYYGVDYDNVFWDGECMVFGDGDGEVF